MSDDRIQQSRRGFFGTVTAFVAVAMTKRLPTSTSRMPPIREQVDLMEALLRDCRVVSWDEECSIDAPTELSVRWKYAPNEPHTQLDEIVRQRVVGKHPVQVVVEQGVEDIDVSVLGDWRSKLRSAAGGRSHRRGDLCLTWPAGWAGGSSRRQVVAPSAPDSGSDRRWVRTSLKKRCPLPCPLVGAVACVLPAFRFWRPGEAALGEIVSERRRESLQIGRAHV